MSAKAREAYEKLSPLTEEQLYIATCPVVERPNGLVFLDERRNQEIPLHPKGDWK